MPETVAQLISLLDLDDVEPMVFRGRNLESSRQRVFGGQVMAQALAAAYRTVAHDRTAHYLSANFLQKGSPSYPIYYSTEASREGASFSTRRIVARQEGRTIFSMTASFHVDEEGLSHADPLPKDVPQPQECPPLAEVLGARSSWEADVWRREWGVLDVRYAGDSTMRHLPSDQGARMQVWVRVVEPLPDDARLHQMALAYASDLTLLAVSTVPHPIEFTSPNLMAASIDHSMWFHRPARADEWLLYDQVSPSASAGLGFSFGRLFSGENLVASCAQEGLIRVLDPDRVQR